MIEEYVRIGQEVPAKRKNWPPYIWNLLGSALV